MEAILRKDAMVWTSVMAMEMENRNDCNIKLMTRYGVEKEIEDDSLGLDLGIWVHSATVQ